MRKYTDGVIRFLSFLAVLGAGSSGVALAQHVPPVRNTPVIVRAAPVPVRPAPIVVAHPPPVVAPAVPIVANPAPIVAPRKPVAVVVPVSNTQPQAIPGRPGWWQWYWNHPVFFQTMPLCFGSSWGTWGMLATPIVGVSLSESPFQVYNAYEFGPWGPQTTPCGSPAFIGF
ncbi:MAG: hypothetical protein JO030_07605 [Candidatus Eremiobacteraeota bacterium]|nr:hypothetical protein [Candidatus Eremiobacteraeota bacterium]